MGTRQEYKDTLARLAADILIDCEREDEYYDHVCEDVSSHVIYTSDCIEILDHSDNCDAHFEDFGVLEVTSYTDAIRAMAHAAMVRDLLEAVEQAKSERVNEAEV